MMRADFLERILRHVSKLRRRKDLKNTFIYFGSSVVTTSFSFITLPFFTNHLTPEEYGIWGYLLGINGFIMPLLILSLNSYYIKTYYEITEPDYTERQRKVLFSTLLFFCLSWTFAIIACSIIIGSFLFQTFNLSVAFFPYAAILLLSNVSYPILTFLPLQYRVEHNAKKYAGIIIGNAITIIICSIVGIIGMEDDLLGRILGFTAGQLLFIILCVPILKRSIVFEISRQEIARGLRICSPLIVPALISVSYTLLDKIILERTTTLSELGYYNIAFQYANILWVILLAVYRAFEPTIFELSAAKNTSAINRLITYIFLALLAIGFLLIVAADFLIPLLTNNRFNQSTYVSKLLTISFIYSAGSILINTYLVSIFRTRLLFYQSIVGLGVFVLLAIYLVPAWGAVGIAYARIGLYILLIMMSLGFIHERSKFWLFGIICLSTPIIITVYI